MHWPAVVRVQAHRGQIDCAVTQLLGKTWKARRGYVELSLFFLDILQSVVVGWLSPGEYSAQAQGARHEVNGQNLCWNQMQLGKRSKDDELSKQA